MENHHFSWENSLFLWPCGHVPVRYVTNYQAGYPKILSFWWLMWRSSHNGSKDPPAETPAALAVSKPQKPWKKTPKKHGWVQKLGKHEGFSMVFCLPNQSWSILGYPCPLWNSHGSSSKSYPSFGSLQSLQLEIPISAVRKGSIPNIQLLL